MARKLNCLLLKDYNMNFQDLLTKIKNIDEGKSIEECGMMPPVMGHMDPPKQSDSVTMNVSMNGSGAGGIRDLMGILKNIEDGGHDEPQAGHAGDDEIIIGGASNLDHKMAELEDSYENEPNPTTTTSVFTGDDLASKGQIGKHGASISGSNGLRETLLQKLASHYDSIKEGKKDDFDPLKHVKNPTKGEKEAAKDVKRGSYKDRAAMLKSAEADGRLKD